MKHLPTDIAYSIYYIQEAYENCFSCWESFEVSTQILNFTEIFSMLVY